MSDVVGYSRLAGADEDRILARLRTLRSDLIDPIISVHHGRVVKRTGDGAIVEFRSVVDAVNCAIEVQRAMVERNAEVAPDKRIEFRIGIHLGDVVEESDGDLMGDGVNIAARIESIAKPGRDLPVRGRLSAGQGAARPCGHRSRPNPTQEHRRADPGLFARRRPAGASKGRADTTAAAGAKSAAPRRNRALSCAGLRSPPLLSSRFLRQELLLGVRASRRVSWCLFADDKLATAPRLSIVVLPFENLSGDQEQQYFADGVTDDLTTDLSHLPDSFVIARNTAFTYKGKPVDAKQIGRELGVRYVLEGSVRRVGENDHGQRPTHLDRNRRACLG